MAELGNSNAVCPTVAGRENASVWAGGRRRRSSPMPRCNGEDIVKVLQGKPVNRKSTDTERKADDGPLRLVHLSVSNGESALPESTGPTGKRSARKRACSVGSGGKAVKLYLSLPKYEIQPFSVIKDQQSPPNEENRNGHSPTRRYKLQISVNREYV
jgi:hypothetical protein